MIGQQLQRYSGQQRFETFDGIGQFNDLVSNPADGLITFGDNGDDLSLSGLHFLDIAQHLLIHGVVRGNNHHGHIRVDECDRSMFHLCSGISLCMNITDFLQFQGTFERHWIVISASEIKEIARVRKHPAEVGNPVVQFENLFHLAGDIMQFSDDAQIIVIGDGTFLFGHRKRQHREHSHLSCKSLGRGHTNLRSYMNIRPSISSSGNTRPDGIADAIDKSSVIFCQFDCSQRVGGFTALRDGNHHIFF